ncbi:LysR substrate-binding domain-containing protein [Colwellia piezophila]|uniref:LysR substrate-binding domain-containing protein n=1 Tax=Colwellia piezophila TaxID=211668 RepID=UPI001FDFD0AD|nr:LysR substrate-binding domain-containing protein [Colwellia piezophila]
MNLLHSFEAAARHQSYSKAATQLCISQAAVSQQMRKLEENLATQLFLRKGKTMLLTQQGKTLLLATQQAFQIIEKNINEITKEEISGSLTISSTQAFTTLWLMPRLSQFSALHPNINIKVMSSAHFENLKEQHIDLAIRFGPQVTENTDSTLTCQYFGEDPVYPVCSAQLAKEMSFTTPDDLLKTWLVSLDKPGRYDWPTWFEHTNTQGYQEHQQWTEVHSTDMALNAVLNGHGFTLAARYLCIAQLNSGQLVMPVNIPHPNVVQRYFVYDEKSAKIARLNVFIRWLKQEMDKETVTG